MKKITYENRKSCEIVHCFFKMQQAEIKQLKLHLKINYF